MKNLSSPISFLNRFRISLFLILVSGAFTMNAQVGIGTTDPDPSSILDIKSESAGLLVPRMTTAERTAIVSPANSLLVFDTDINSFYYYDTRITEWVRMNVDVQLRKDYKLIQSATDLATELAAGGGSKFLLTPHLLYEINGIIMLGHPIDLNGATIIGLDEHNDVLTRNGGVLFEGAIGGHIENLSLSAPSGTVFNLNDPSGTGDIDMTKVIIKDSGSVGTISGFEHVYMDKFEFERNEDGITFSNINNVSLYAQEWFGSNGGTYKKFVGEFNKIAIESGLSEVIGATAALDITGIAQINGGAVLENIFFTGGGNYINGNSPYFGHNFTNDWNVDSPGIVKETDDVATGNIYLTGSPVQTDLGTAPTKLNMTTTSSEMFRTESTVDNRITYKGAETRKFTIAGSFSIEGASNNSIPIISIAKNGTVLTATKIAVKMAGGGDVQALSITGTTTLEPNDYIELFGEGNGHLKISALNLLIY